MPACLTNSITKDSLRDDKDGCDLHAPHDNLLQLLDACSTLAT